jgi:hypothetical protein
VCTCCRLGSDPTNVTSGLCGSQRCPKKDDRVQHMPNNSTVILPNRRWIHSFCFALRSLAFPSPTQLKRLPSLPNPMHSPSAAIRCVRLMLFTTPLRPPLPLPLRSLPSEPVHLPALRSSRPMSCRLWLLQRRCSLQPSRQRVLLCLPVPLTKQMRPCLSLRSLAPLLRHWEPAVKALCTSATCTYS